VGIKFGGFPTTGNFVDIYGGMKGERALI